ncbi:unnamed protein product [Pseudo-nitzschia multistriata]|uniref:Uncharacterized protein n=1 Tax=Pseudo-nitzschia multistriata TaxID=183589 RepID=A0A448ZLM7_9STRA|nr:unnamed protein product [Pseudo-nitzschia multistriata]
MVGCSINDFSFFDSSGNLVLGEYNDDGICIFEEANCNPRSSPRECCAYNPESANDDGLGGWADKYLLLCLMVPMLYLYQVVKKKAESQIDEGRTNGKGEPASCNDVSESISCWKKPIKFIHSMGYLIFSMMIVPATIVTRKSYQANMSVSQMNLLMSAEAFMIPFGEIFQCIEDVVLVQIGYAIGRSDKPRTDHLIHVGIAGSIVTGTVAGLIGTILALWPSAFALLTNPGRKHDQSLYEGCEWFEGNDDYDRWLILPYWMMKSWAMVFQQIGMVLSGFFFGAKAIADIGWILLFSLTLTLYIWFSNVGTWSNPLTLVGIADISGDIVLPVLAISFLASPLASSIRERTGLSLSGSKVIDNLRWQPTNGFAPVVSKKVVSDNGEFFSRESTSLIGNRKSEENSAFERSITTNNEAPNGTNNTMKLFVEGFKVMFMDVAIQGCTSFTYYVALRQDSEVAYQITALQSALPQYGYGYAVGISIIFKLTGSQLLAKGKNKLFVVFAKICIVSVLAMIPAIVAEVLEARHTIALEYGSNACSYAQNSNCVPFFEAIFGPNANGGGFTLQYTFTALAFGAVTDSVSLVLRSVLLALLDFDFLVNSTICAVGVYIPSMYAATCLDTIYKGQAISYYVAMNMPQLVLILVLLVRLKYNFRKVLDGEEGPWTETSPEERSNDEPSSEQISSSFSYKEEMGPLINSKKRRSSLVTVYA